MRSPSNCLSDRHLPNPAWGAIDGTAEPQVIMHFEGRLLQIQGPGRPAIVKGTKVRMCFHHGSSQDAHVLRRCQHVEVMHAIAEPILEPRKGRMRAYSQM